MGKPVEKTLILHSLKMNNLEEFVSHVSKAENPQSDWSELMKSLWWARKGDWNMAHNIAQDVDSSDGSWVHAYLHRVEGDLGNAAYWYRRAGKPIKTDECLDGEWKEISKSMLSCQN